MLLLRRSTMRAGVQGKQMRDRSTGSACTAAVRTVHEPQRLHVHQGGHAWYGGVACLQWRLMLLLLHLHLCLLLLLLVLQVIVMATPASLMMLVRQQLSVRSVALCSLLLLWLLAEGCSTKLLLSLCSTKLLWSCPVQTTAPSARESLLLSNLREGCNDRLHLGRDALWRRRLLLLLLQRLSEQPGAIRTIAHRTDALLLLLLLIVLQHGLNQVRLHRHRCRRTILIVSLLLLLLLLLRRKESCSGCGERCGIVEQVWIDPAGCACAVAERSACADHASRAGSHSDSKSRGAGRQCVEGSTHVHEGRGQLLQRRLSRSSACEEVLGMQVRRGEVRRGRLQWVRVMLLRLSLSLRLSLLQVEILLLLLL